ncbi:MAG: DUF72 domain-containing protein [Desulfurococcales archaeon]|nr:DUF72 domain-containing protein [Desulfurococcales archaeon]
MDIRVGVCGLPRRIEVLSEKLDVVEVQETFYRPKPGKYPRWKKRAPGLEFTVKAWFLITHGWNRFLARKARLDEAGLDLNTSNIGGLKPTAENFKLLEEVINAARELDANLIIFQTPSSFKPLDINGISEFMRQVKEKGFTPVWEVRGSTLEYKEELARITGRTSGLVLSTDILRGFLPVDYGNNILYTRLHGLGGRQVNYKYKYTFNDLKRLLNQVLYYIENRMKTVSYVMFNNIYMFDDATSFKRVLEQLNLGK